MPLVAKRLHSFEVELHGVAERIDIDGQGVPCLQLVTVCIPIALKKGGVPRVVVVMKR
jgi:hypothetical protein